MAQVALYRYCRLADGVLNSKGPLSSTIAPSVLAKINRRWSEAWCRWPEEKVRFVWIISPLHIWEEGASSSVRQCQWSYCSSNWLAPRYESTWPIRMASKHDRTYVHARGLVITTLGLALGWQSRKLKPRKLMLKAYFDFSRNLAPTKITCRTVYWCILSLIIPIYMYHPSFDPAIPTSVIY